MSLTLAFFGGFQAIVHEQPATFATDQARALLVYLAVEADQPHRREALATLLWADDLESSARHNLNQTLLRLRQAIGDRANRDSANSDKQQDSTFLEISRQSLQLKQSAPITTDVRQFQGLVAATSSHSHRDLSQCAACCERLQPAVDLYHGPFLDGFQLANSAPFEEWLRFTANNCSTKS